MSGARLSKKKKVTPTTKRKTPTGSRSNLSISTQGKFERLNSNRNRDQAVGGLSNKEMQQKLEDEDFYKN